MAGLRADNRNQHVVDHLIAPLLAGRKPPPQWSDPLAELISIRDRLRHCSQGVLIEAREALGAEWARDFPNQPACVRAVEACKAKPSGGVRVTRGSAGFASWLAHYETTRHWAAKHMAEAQEWTVPTEWPPGAAPGPDDGTAAAGAATGRPA